MRSAPGRLKVWIADQINAASFSSWGPNGRYTVEFDAHGVDVRAAQGHWRTSRYSEACRWDAWVPAKVTYHDRSDASNTYQANVFSECWTMTELRRGRWFALADGGEGWLSFEPCPPSWHPLTLTRLANEYARCQADLR